MAFRYRVKDRSGSLLASVIVDERKDGNGWHATIVPLDESPFAHMDGKSREDIEKKLNEELPDGGYLELDESEPASYESVWRNRVKTAR